MSSNSSRTRTIVKYSLAAVTFAAVSLIGFNFYLQVCGPFLSPLLVTPDQSFLVLAQTTRPRGDGDSSSSSSRNSNGGERKREVTGKGDQRKRSRKVTITADSFMAKAPVPPQVLPALRESLKLLRENYDLYVLAKVSSDHEEKEVLEVLAKEGFDTNVSHPPPAPVPPCPCPSGPLL